MKKVLDLALMAIMSFTLTTTALAAETTNINDVDSLYKNAYNQAKSKVENAITVNNNLVILQKEIPEDSRVILYSEVMDLMPEARAKRHLYYKVRS
jgi:hypothetical protein